MKRIEDHDEIFETFIEPEDVTADLMDIKEVAKINSIIAKLKMYGNNPVELTKLYTNILIDDNVAFMLTKISQDQIFVQQFPEFYVVNEYGENFFNCQQNSTYHKYGVFKHTLSTIESVGNFQTPMGDWQKRILKWTMLLHDLGKPYVKIIAEDGSESFAGHDDKSEELSKDILDRFNFDESEKKIILKLIKYHDRFLNEGEITNDNMKFLASEFNNDKELFNLLLDVKSADARAKNIEVYNNFKMVKTKYLEFLNNYFSFEIQTENSEENELKEEVTSSELSYLLDSVLDKKAIKTLYQPIIDISAQKVWGYEVFTKIESKKRVDIIDFFNYAKDTKKYEKLQQILLINGIENFETLSDKESKKIFVNTDLNSYQKYINKPRVHDMMGRSKISLEFQNYEKKDIVKFQETIAQVHSNGGYVALDQFGSGSYGVDDISLLDIDYIVTDVSFVRGLVEDLEKQKYIAELVTYALSKECLIIVIGVEDLSTLQVLKKLGVNLVQGYYFSKPTEKISSLNEVLTEKLEELNQATIS